jgi:hypothetical protein
MHANKHATNKETDIMASLSLPAFLAVGMAKMFCTLGWHNQIVLTQMNQSQSLF